MRPREPYVVIPTYQRADVIENWTLRTLERVGWPMDRVDLWVANDDEAQAYAEHVSPLLYGRIKVGVPGLPQQRDVIARNYPSGAWLISMDDDVRGLVPKSIPERQFDLEQWSIRAFETAERCRVTMWGVYPGSNAVWMSGKPRFGWVTLVGPMFGLIVDHRADHQLTNMPFGDDRQHIEDAYRSALMFRGEGGLLRLEDLGILHSYYGNAGGVSEDRNIEKVLRAAVAIKADFPDLFEIVWRKQPSGKEWPELRELPIRERNLI